MSISKRRFAAIPARIVAVLGLACATASSAELVDIKWSASGTFSSTVTVPPSKFAEVCGALEPGESVRWTFAGDRPLDFNVHYHVGKEVRYPAKQDAVATAEGRLDVTERQSYCWMWSNRGALEARLRLTLAR